MRVIVDAMGGDNAPLEIVKGAVQAANDNHIDVILVGKKDQINEILSKETVTGNVTVVHAEDVIDNHEQPTEAVRNNKDSSMVKAFQMLKDGEGDALVSAGSTGALLVASIRYMGRIKGVIRPALAATLPGKAGNVLLLDSGANTNCRPANFQQFGIMGAAYVENLWKIPRPKVGLLNIGAEDSKGDDTTKEAYELLEAADINFGGNVEGREIMEGEFPVVVADGFSGNVALKSIEGTAKVLMSYLKDALTKNLKSKLGAALIMDGLRDMKKKVDYENTGGAPLLGIDGVVIKAHGSSRAKSVYWCIKQANEFAETRLVDRIRGEIEKVKKAEEN